MEEKLQFESLLPAGPALAIAYVPAQKWQNLYSSETGWNRGTLFAELDKPFIGEEAVCRG